MKISKIAMTADINAWRGVGFGISADGYLPLANCSLVLTEATIPSCIESWTLNGQGTGDICGVKTEWTSEEVTPVDVAGLIHSVRLDHVMVQAADPGIVINALANVGGTNHSPAGEASTSESIMLGDVRIDVLASDSIPMGEASLFGIALEVNGLAELCERLGPDVLGAMKPATQPGWFVSAFRSGAGLGIPCALMARG